MLVDDQSLLRAGFRLVLEQDTDLEVVAEAADGSQAVSTGRRYRPDVILMDIRMPVMDGVEATRAILGIPELADTRIVVLTTFEIDDYITDALQAVPAGSCPSRSSRRSSAAPCTPSQTATRSCRRA